MTTGVLARSPEEGARLLALAFLDQAAAARERLADPADAEALHDFRVGLRRLRSCLQAYRTYLEDSVPRKLARRLRRLANATGPGRDTEVQIQWLRSQRPHLTPHQRAGLAWAVSRWEERKHEAYTGLREEIDREFAAIEGDLRRRLSVYRTEVHLDATGPRPTLPQAAAAILHGQIAELTTHVAGIEGADDEEEAHAARIRAKRIRYLLEPFAEEVPSTVPIIRRFKSLQDLLGDLHDAHVLEAELCQAVETAAAERARALLAASLAEAPDESLLRAERRRYRESGLIALARLNRARRNRLFATLEGDWLDGRADELLRQLADLDEEMAAAQPDSPTA